MSKEAMTDIEAAVQNLFDVATNVIFDLVYSDKALPQGEPIPIERTLPLYTAAEAYTIARLVALDRADEQPEGTIFIIPLKLEECSIPDRLSHLHWNNFFDEKGYERLIRALKYQANTTTPGSPSLTSQSAKPTAKGGKDPDLSASTVGQFMIIPAGEFMMGSNNGRNNEKPVHRVRISRGFEMGKFEVTQAQWEAVMGSDPSHFKGSNLPVEKVSWEEVQKFIQVLNSRSKKYIYRLPTEAEWEYACRAGSTSDYAGDLDSMAWYEANSEGTTHPVGQKQPNAWGLYDMHGNVWEWCQDWYGDYPSENVTVPQRPASGSLQVLRGGSWYDTATYCRSAYRGKLTPGDRGNYLGFRLVRTPR